jgi:hypothetical protein
VVEGGGCPVLGRVALLAAHAEISMEVVRGRRVARHTGSAHGWAQQGMREPTVGRSPMIPDSALRGGSGAGGVGNCSWRHTRVMSRRRRGRRSSSSAPSWRSGRCSSLDVRAEWHEWPPRSKARGCPLGATDEDG